MKLIPFEQSGFILETNKGFKLAFDIGSYTPEEKLAGVFVDAMLISHFHGDHFSVPHIKLLAADQLYLNAECKALLGEDPEPFGINIVKVGDSIAFDGGHENGGITVDLFNVDHGPNVSAPVKENFGFLLKADDETVYFGGDIFHPSGMDVSDLEVDYALLPVGGHYTFGPQEALAFAKQFKNIGKIIPMHYEIRPEAKDEFLTIAEAAGFSIGQ